MISGSSLSCSTNWPKSLFCCQCESLSSLQSHAQLIFKMNKVQNLKWWMKQSSRQNLLPTHHCLAQLVTEWWLGGHGFTLGQFLMKFILFCLTLDVSDNLTEMREKPYCYILIEYTATRPISVGSKGNIHDCYAVMHQTKKVLNFKRHWYSWAVWMSQSNIVLIILNCLQFML